MNRPKLGYLVFGAALLLALVTPPNAGSAGASLGYQTTVPTVVSRSVTAVVPVERYVDRYYYYRTYEDIPRGYVVHRDFDGYDHYYRPYVDHHEYHAAPGIDIRVPFFSFRFGH